MRETVDLAQIRNRCPLLLAAWYETLRLHMTGVPREAVADFELGEGERIRKGDILFLPMAEANRDPDVWGRPGEFLPERFIGEDGRVQYALARKVKTFGVAGNLCPGRHHSFGIIMGVVVSVLLTVDVEPVEGGWGRPVAARSVSAGGFDRCENEVRATLSKKNRWQREELILQFSGNLF